MEKHIEKTDKILYISVIFIIALVFVLRTVQILEIPPSLNWDEISHGYNAYSILKTGKDEWGVTFPTIFRSYGDYKLPVYIYLTAVSEFFFGLSSFAVRLPSLVAGLTTVLFTYLLVGKLFDKKVAILASLLIAIEPWSFFLSRGAFEANLSLAFIVSGVYFFMVGLKNHKLLILSSILLGLSVWTYNSARVFVPLLLVFLILLYRKKLIKAWKEKKIIVAYCLLPIALFFLPMFWQLINPIGQARYGWVEILDEGAIAQINKARVNSSLPDSLPVLVHNKGIYFISEFTKNYFSHFSPNFLFFQGGTQFQFNIPDKGLIYPTELPFIVIGLLSLVVRRDRTSAVLLGWLILSPIASSLTREAPHTLRAITMLPMPMVITAVGAISVWSWLKKLKIENFKLKILMVGYFIIMGGFAKNYLTIYFTKYPKEYSWSWQYGYKEAVGFAKQKYNKYDAIIISKKYGEPHEFFLFYWPWDPEKYRNDPNLIRFYQSNWYWVDRFDKFYFVNDWEIPKDGSAGWRMESGGTISMDGGVLLITSPGNYPPGWRLLKTINFLDGKPAFDILENRTEDLGLRI